MKLLLLFVTTGSVLSGVVTVFGTPAPKLKLPQKAPAKAVTDPLEIPAFAPIPNEFIFAGTQKDVYKLLERYTGGTSLSKIPEAQLEKLAPSGDKATVQALLDVKHLVDGIHVLRVRSISYKGLDEAAREAALQKLAPKAAKGEEEGGFSRYNRGHARSKELLGNAETFYKTLLAKQGGQVQMQLRGETSITVYAFSQPRTFAVVTRGPSRVIVARADGKPDVGAMTSIFQRVVAGN
jgi:hypothetical protein